jgi:cyclopropane-fatty-acyl-phospholipid synthase
VLPSVAQIGATIEDLFIVEDWHNFGPDYDKTLLAWNQKFQSDGDSIKHCYDERFRRMWTFYLLASAGGFRSRNIELWQIVLAKRGIPGGYATVR